MYPPRARNPCLILLLMEIRLKAQGKDTRLAAWPPHAGSKAIRTPLLPQCYYKPSSITPI